MERLTGYNSFGGVYGIGMRCGDNTDTIHAIIKRLAEYEDIGATPDELKTAVSLYIEMSQKMRKIIKDMKYYLDANEEDGVVYIPKFVIEEIAYGR